MISRFENGESRFEKKGKEGKVFAKGRDDRRGRHDVTFDELI